MKSPESEIFHAWANPLVSNPRQIRLGHDPTASAGFRTFPCCHESRSIMTLTLRRQCLRCREKPELYLGLFLVAPCTASAYAKCILSGINDVLGSPVVSQFRQKLESEPPTFYESPADLVVVLPINFGRTVACTGVAPRLSADAGELQGGGNGCIGERAVADT